MPQESNSLVQALREWFNGCPLLQPGAKVGVDYLPEAPTEYAVYESPSTIRYRENVLGEITPAQKQEQNFIFASKEPFGADTAQNMLNAAFYEAILLWIWTQNGLRNYPRFQSGTVTNITPTLTAYPAEVGSDVAKYQIQLKVTYNRRD